MRFYLASSFALKDRCAELKAILEDDGHQVPDVWWETDFKAFMTDNDERWHAHPLVKTIAERHWHSISGCDAVILVSDETPGGRRFTGANIEAGFAIGRGIPVFSVGNIERSGMYSRVIRCPDLGTLMQVLSIFCWDKPMTYTTEEHATAAIDRPEAFR